MPYLRVGCAIRSVTGMCQTVSKLAGTCMVHRVGHVRAEVGGSKGFGLQTRLAILRLS